jgi:hypothetical protein
VTPTITLTATDTLGLTATHSFLVTPTLAAQCVATCATIAAPHQVITIRLSPTAANVSGAGTTPFKAYATYSDAPATPVDVTALATWTATGSDLAVPSNGSVSYSGTVLGTGAINATLGGVTGSANVRVWDATRLASLQSLVVNGLGSGVNGLAHGVCFPISVTATFADTSTEDVTANMIWEDAGRGYNVVLGNVFTVNTGYNGNYFNVTGTLGTAVTSSNLLYHGGDLFAGSCTDPRLPGAALAVALSPGNGALYLGQTALLTGNVYYADGSVRDRSASIAFSTCSPALLDVASDGWVTGLPNATSGQTGTVLGAFGPIGGSATFAIQGAPTFGAVTAVFVEPTANNLATGTSAPARAIAQYANLPGYLFNVTPQTTWSSSDTTILTVASSTAVTQTTAAVGVGTAKVLATFSGITTAETVRGWSPARLAQITSTAVGGNVGGCIGGQLDMTATFSDNTTEDVTASTVWVATGGNGSPMGDFGYGFLSPDGYFTEEGHYTGYAQIMASLGRGIDRSHAATIGIWGPCPGPTCSDGVQNGWETGVDCGGPGCSPCASTQACLAGTDCTSGSCVGLVCQ